MSRLLLGRCAKESLTWHAAVQRLAINSAPLRRITVGAYQQRVETSQFQGVNQKLAPSRPEKREEMHAFHDAAGLANSAEQYEAIKKILSHTQDRQFSEALAAFRAVPERSAKMYGVALNACAKGLRVSEAKQLWQEMPVEWRSHVTYGTMLDLCRRTKNVQDAEDFLADMKAAGLQPNIIDLRSMMGVYGMVGDTTKAMDVFTQIKATFLKDANEVSKQMTFVAIMSAFARKGDYKTVRELFEEMSTLGVTPDHTHFNCLLTSCVQGKYVDIAEAIIELMPKWGLEPRVEDHTVMVSACRSDLPRCKAAFAKIIEAGLAPQFITYRRYIDAHLECGASDAVPQLLTEAEGTARCDRRYIDDVRRRLAADRGPTHSEYHPTKTYH